MGRSSDRLYVTHGEWKTGQIRGGLTRERQRQNLLEQHQRDYQILPLGHCALSLRPAEIPVCTPEGILYDLDELERHLRLNSDADAIGQSGDSASIADPLGTASTQDASLYGPCPITGRPLQPSDLVRLQFKRNAAGEFCCPVTGRIFTPNTRVLCSKRNGRVYSVEAVEQMVETGVDFCTDQPCRRSDFIVLNNPDMLYSGMEGRRAGGAASKTLAATDSGAAVEHPSGPPGYSNSLTCTADLGGDRRIRTGDTSATVQSTQTRRNTQLPSSNPSRPIKPTKQAIVVIRTTHGDLEAVLEAPRVPLAVFNFLALARRGDYCNSPIHSIRPGHSLMSGQTDSGQSVYGEAFPGEFHPSLRHDRRGSIGLCNAGRPDSNATQFYMTLGALPDLDDRNVLMGRLRPGHSASNLALDSLEAVPCDPDGRPLEFCAVLDIVVMQDPFRDKHDEAALKAQAKAAPRPTRSASNPAPPKIGKYLKL